MYVYALGDPRTQEIRYVGIAQDVYRRYAQHLIDPHPNDIKNAWMREIKNAGFLPTLILLESDISKARIYEREKHRIHHYLAQGAPLTNITHAQTMQRKTLDKVQRHSETEPFNLDEWYTPTQAAERLTANSGKKIDISYVRTLARYGKIRSFQISERIRLYSRNDVDNYIVEERGEKSGRAKRQTAINKRPPKEAA
jgi:hypothetical protein